MTDTSVTAGTESAAAAAQPAMTADEARAKGRDLTAAADRETDVYKRRQLNDEAQKHFQLATGGRMVGQKDAAHPSAPTARQTLGGITKQGDSSEEPAPAAQPARTTTQARDPERAEREAIMDKVAGGKLTYEQFEMIASGARPWAARLDTAWEKGEDAYRAEIQKGEAEVLRTIYRGSSEAMRLGLLSIVDAIKLAFGEDRAPAIIEQIDSHSALANAKVHDQILTWARATLK